jgi:hypothetical protein
LGLEVAEEKHNKGAMATAGGVDDALTSYLHALGKEQFRNVGTAIGDSELEQMEVGLWRRISSIQEN